MMSIEYCNLSNGTTQNMVAGKLGAKPKLAQKVSTRPNVTHTHFLDPEETLKPLKLTLNLSKCPNPRQLDN
jgi:hypothetical protein